MHTNRLPTVNATVATRCQYQLGEGQGGEPVHWRPMSGVVAGAWGEVLDSEFQCIMGNGHIGTPLPMDRMIDRHDWNISFPKFHWRAVI